MSIRFMTARQCAQLIGVSVGTLARWRGVGKGPNYCKLGNSIRYMLEDVIKWAHDNDEQSTVLINVK